MDKLLWLVADNQNSLKMYTPASYMIHFSSEELCILYFDFSHFPLWMIWQFASSVLQNIVDYASYELEKMTSIQVGPTTLVWPWPSIPCKLWSWPTGMQKFKANGQLIPNRVETDRRMEAIALPPMFTR